MPTPQHFAFSQGFARLKAPLRRWWRSRDPHFRHRVRLNLLVVAVIELLLLVGHRLQLPLVLRMENWGIDRVISFLGTRPEDHTDQPWVAITLIDIDDPTWESWGTPSVVPRDRLQQLLTWAASSQAAAVIIDVDLSRPQGLNGQAPDSSDLALARYLSGYRGPVPIILARILVPAATAAGLPGIRPVWFEPMLPDSARRWIRWGTVEYVEEGDGVVRRWRLWEPVCLDGTHPGALPSIELLLPSLISSGPATAAADSVRLARLLGRVTPANCTEPGSGLHSDDETVDSLWGKPVRPSHELVTQRIVFQIPWNQPDRASAARVALATGSEAPLFTRISAGVVTGRDELPSGAGLRGRIVIIGGSYREGRDRHQTPIGPMPGAMMLTNAIASFRSHGQLQPLSWPWRVTTIVLLGAFTALAYAWLHPLLATGVSALVLLFIVAPISFLVFRDSVWLDFAVPLLSIQAHEIIADLEEAWKSRGWRDPPAARATHDR